MNEYQVSNIAIVWPSSRLRLSERRIRACVVLNVSGSNPVVLHTTFYQCHLIVLYWFALLFCPLAQVSRSVRIRKKESPEKSVEPMQCRRQMDYGLYVKHAVN